MRREEYAEVTQRENPKTKQNLEFVLKRRSRRDNHSDHKGIPENKIKAQRSGFDFEEEELQSERVNPT